MGLGALISKMPFLVTIVIGDLNQIFVLPLQWLVAVLIIPRRRIGRINPNGWREALRSWTVRAMITTTSSITSIVLMIFLRPVQSFGILGALKRLKSRLLRLEKVPFKDFFFGTFVRLKEGSIAPRTVNIYFSNPRRKIKGGFSFRGNGFLNGLLSSILSMAILLGLGMHRRP